ncbi:mechanosensitive ion channel protein MscS [Rhodospirillum rubrum]|uniref:mechanosensitive ion channel family protein n=1 Tax=Rhodospirillum rubrum TaxID=1085 RepID=UPI0019069B5D|nr:mechanosensitive ion channel domain-containing protein [Rhodospirillum rubrum]MBK1665159.1 mechanosensitive ion channel protein MscS [Rhodospirillum rubrum]MBK1675083.1 mechanosensitive ion channel protein MscS [Rhodospirillum rubrum]
MRCVWAAVAAVFCLVAVALPVSAQTSPGPAATTAAPEVPVLDRLKKAAATWEPTLNDVDKRLNRPLSGRDAETLDGLATRLRAVRDEAVLFRQAATDRLAETEKLIEALGPPPKEGEGEESKDMKARRQSYADLLGTWKSRQADIEVTAARAETLLNRISEIRRSTLVTSLFDPTPLPWMPDVLARGGPELLDGLLAIAASPVDWYQSGDQADRREAAFNAIGVWIILAGGTGWVVRWWMQRRFGRRPDIESPPYGRRLIAALAEATAEGIIPALVLGGMIAWITKTWTDDQGLFTRVMVSGLLNILLVLITRAVTRAALSPGLPSWRLTDHGDQQASKLAHIVVVLAMVVAVDRFITGIAVDMPPSDASTWIVSALFKLCEGLILIRLSNADLWGRPKPEEGTEDGAPKAQPLATPSQEDDEAKAGEGAFRLLLLLVRLSVMLVTVVGMMAGLVGYGRLGIFLIDGLLATCAILGAALVLRGLLHELIGVAVRWSWLRDRAGYEGPSLNKMKFWLQALFDPLLIVGVVMAASPSWGVPWRDVLDGTVTLLTGVTIGSVRISIVDIAVGILVFLVAMAITRVAQGTLQRKVLSQTGMDAGVRHSLTAVLGYVGLVTAAALAVGTMGIDLTNIALIAGALSVGIGFGLQNIVNNFVSGLIILVERPVKVGDWVIIGSHEGLVKRISFRATELETFTQASVVIPNAEILSSPFTNLTLRNRLGRIDVSVLVIMNSDTRKVRDLLLEIARAHPQVLTLPAPWVVLKAFADTGLEFEVRSYTSNVMNRGSIASDMRLEIDRRFREEGVVMPAPLRPIITPAAQTAVHPIPDDQAIQVLAPSVEERPVAEKTPLAEVKPVDVKKPSISGHSTPANDGR